MEQRNTQGRDQALLEQRLFGYDGMNVAGNGGAPAAGDGYGGGDAETYSLDFVRAPTAEPYLPVEDAQVGTAWEAEGEREREREVEVQRGWDRVGL